MAPKDDSLELVETFEEGAFVFREGERGDCMYIIEQGQVEILLEGEGKPRRLALLAEGDFFGEMAVLEELPRTASARAVTACSLLRIDRPTFDQLIRHNPEIAVRMLRKLCHRLRTVQPHPLEAPAVPAPPVATPGGEAAFLLHKASGTRFPLGEGGEATVGRQDPATGLSPTVDLGEVDKQKTTSRRHAVLVFKDGTWYLREEVGVRNGTFVNGRRLAPGEACPVSPGDLLRFGLVELEFHQA